MTGDEAMRVMAQVELAALSVELPGIEPAAETAVTAEHRIRRRETTRIELRIHRVVLTASTPGSSPGW